MKKKPKLEKTPRTIPFYNNTGDRILVPENYKIDDLIRMGVKEIRFEKKGSFLPDGWYSNDKPTRTKKPKQQTKGKQ